jgi:uncharacterized membrane protein
MGTVIFGAIYLIIWWSREGYTWNTWAIAILTGGTLGIIMWANVWLVIWPKQKVVIANAIATAGGAPANPAAASAGRRAALASRTNVLFSIPMLRLAKVRSGSHQEPAATVSSKGDSP